jgi:hypothetical protein
LCGVFWTWMVRTPLKIRLGPQRSSMEHSQSLAQLSVWLKAVSAASPADTPWFEWNSRTAFMHTHKDSQFSPLLVSGHTSLTWCTLDHEGCGNNACHGEESQCILQSVFVYWVISCPCYMSFLNSVPSASPIV